MDFIGSHLLSLLVLLPLLGIPFIIFAGEKRAKFIALIFSFSSFLLSINLLLLFDPSSPDYQFEEVYPWIEEFGINFSLGVDGISLFLVLLTELLTPIAILSCFNAVREKVRGYMSLFLLLETGMVGTFLATDIFLFYIFWELVLIPMYFIIGIWGGRRRVYAAIKFVLFTMAGSLLMLVAIIFLYFEHGHNFHEYSTYLPDLLRLSLPVKDEVWLFLFFSLAFAIKVPVFPLHTWLPDAHVEAPTAGSVVLAGILLKMGTYGFLRFAIPLFPFATIKFTPLFITLAVIGIVYGALVSLVQDDVKSLVAFSSVSHLGFIMLGIFAFNLTSIQGSILQMVNHGLSTGALFLIVGMLYERRKTRMIRDFGGLSSAIPLLSFFFMIVVLSSIGLPPLNGFIGEFLILIGSFRKAQVATMFGTLGIILSACYLLYMWRRVMFGPCEDERNKTLKDLSTREFILLLPIAMLIVVLGIFPNFFLKRMEPSVHALLIRFEERVKDLAPPPEGERVSEPLRTGQSIEGWTIEPRDSKNGLSLELPFEMERNDRAVISLDHQRTIPFSMKDPEPYLTEGAF